MVTSVRAVAYWRMSTSSQEKSIPQQRAEMLPRAKLAGVDIVREFEDQGISGGGMAARDAFRELVQFCQASRPPVEAVVVFDTARFSRASSIETNAYIWQLQQAGTHRVLTWERWWDFRKEEDRAVFNIQQDFTNNRFLRDLSLRVLRGRKDVALAGYFTGGQVPYGFDRVVMGPGGMGQRYHRGAKIVRQRGERMGLVPIAADDADPGRQLERQTALWLFETFDGENVSMRELARRLNERGVPGPGTPYRRVVTKPCLWIVRSVKGILTNPVYKGTLRFGVARKGKYHRLVDGEIAAVAPGEARVDVPDEALARPLPEGLVPVELFDRVQRKLAGRSGKAAPRRGGYALPPGLLMCGHCGGRMHGSTTRHVRNGRKFEYRRYSCSAVNVKPGACLRYSVSEDQVMRLLLEQVLDDYLSEPRLGAVERALEDRLEVRHRRMPATLERLRKRLAELDREITEAARMVFRFPENADLFNAEVNRLRQERSRLEKEMGASLRDADVPQEQSRERVRAAVASLRLLRGRLADWRKGPAGLAELGEMLRRVVSRVELYFHARPSQSGLRTAYFLTRNVIKFRPIIELGPAGGPPGGGDGGDGVPGCVTSGSSCVTQPGNFPLVLAFTL